MRAIDAYDIRPEQQADADQPTWPPFHQPKEKRWRFSNINLLDPADLLELKNGAWEIAATLPWKVIAIYVAGSYVLDSADDSSDVDLGFLFEDHEAVKKEWSHFDGEHWIWHVDKIGKQFFYKVNEVSCRLGISIQPAPWWGGDIPYYDLATGKTIGEIPAHDEPIRFKQTPDGPIAVAKTDEDIWEPGHDAYADN